MEDYKYRLDQLQRKVKEQAKASLTFINKATSKYKRKLVAGLCLATAITAGAYIDNVKAEGIAVLNVEKIYHVYVDGSRIGSVDDHTIVDRLINEKIKEFSNSFADVELVIGEEVRLIPEFVFTSRINNSITLSELENRITVKADAIALVVDGEEVAYVNSQAEYEAVVNQLMLQYVSEEELTALNTEAPMTMAATFDVAVSPEPEIGEKLLLDVRLSKEIAAEKVPASPSNVLSIDDAVKQLNLGTLEEEVYVVEPGDVLGSIALAHGLSIQELLALNPSVTENSLLQIGDELNVTVYEPIVKVVVEEATKVKEEIPFQTETKEDANMWRGDTKVQQEGKAGERVVNYHITRENGRTIQKQVVSEEITKEPQNRIVVKGTKVSPSRGTGRLSWPAVGGYISSYQGMRWGRFHRGIDIARPSNRNILAADNGTVSFAGWDGGYGNKVIINHNNGMRTIYAHLSSISVRSGQTVAQGQQIGVMGSTGNSTGVHLHFEVYQNGKLRNPMDFLNR